MSAMSNEELTSRVNKLRENDGYILDALEDIASVQRQHTRRLKAHDARFDAVDARFDGVDARFDGIDARLDGIDSTLQEVLRRLPEPPQP